MPLVRVAALLALLLCLLVAGCGQPSQDADDKAGPAVDTDNPEGLHGVILDPAVRPLAGALVRLSAGDLTMTTGPDGVYAFPEAPRGEVLIVTASLNGYVAASRQTSLPDEGPVRLDLTLQPVPAAGGYVEVLKFDGLIGCEAAVVVSEQVVQSADCGGDVDPGAAVWDFNVATGLTSAVIEVAWEPTTPAAEGLGAKLVQPGGDGTALAEKVGRSPVRLVVPQVTAARLFANGGSLQLTVFAMPITDEDEQAAAASVAVQQSFQAFASMFYGMAPDPAYSFVEGDGR